MIILRVMILFSLLSLFSCGRETIQIKFPTDNDNSTDSAKTIDSFIRYDGFSVINYYGDYKEKKEWLYEYFREKIPRDGTEINCSIFNTSFDSTNLFFCRNFDDNIKEIVICKTNPSDGYSSVSFAKLSDWGIKFDEDNYQLSSNDKKKIIYFAPFYPMDGMNEMGLAIAIASVKKQEIISEPNKEKLFISFFIREVLDNCKNVFEVIELLKKIEIYDKGLIIISNHFLITDSESNSLIVEYVGGKISWKLIKGESEILTNNLQLDGSENYCDRYTRLRKRLSESDCGIDVNYCIDLLEDVSQNTAWSSVYNLYTGEIFFSIHKDYSTIYRINLWKEKEIF